MILVKLLNMSYVASFMIVAIIIIRFFIKKMPKKIVCALWGLVAIRLVFPISLESILSLVPSSQPIPERIEMMEEPVIHSGVKMIDRSVNPIMTEYFTAEDTVSDNLLREWGEIASIIWLIGLVGMGLYAIVSYLLLYRKVRASIEVERGIYICDYIESPFVLGMIRPHIYLPSGMDEDISKYVIAHEKAHLRRLDYLWKPFGFLILSVYWFHPLVWVAYVMLCRDIELACDEKVVKDMELKDKKAYSKALISYRASRRMIAVCPLGFGEVGLKDRVKSVLNYKKPSFWIMCVSVVVTIGIVIFFMTNPVNEKQSKEHNMEYTESAAVVPESSEDDLSNVDLTEADLQSIGEKYIKEYEKINYSDTSVKTFDDRQFACLGKIHNELEMLVYNYYYHEASGEYDKIRDAIGDVEHLQISVDNEEKSFKEGNYLSECFIQELNTLSEDTIMKLDNFMKKMVFATIDQYELDQYAIVQVKLSWKYNEEWLSKSPQLPEGEYDRYYLIGTSMNEPSFKIYDFYWEDFLQ